MEVEVVVQAGRGALLSTDDDQVRKRAHRAIPTPATSAAVATETRKAPGGSASFHRAAPRSGPKMGASAQQRPPVAASAMPATAPAAPASTSAKRSRRRGGAALASPSMSTRSEATGLWTARGDDKHTR